MKTINIFTENIFDGWEVNEKDVIQKTREMLEHYIQTLGDRSCLFEKEYQTITLDIVFCDSAKTHELNRDYRNKDYPADIITLQSLQMMKIVLFLTVILISERL